MKLGRNDLCLCNSGKKFKKCCGSPHSGLTHIQLVKTKEEITGVRRACKLAAQVLATLGERIRPGVSTQELNDFAHQFTLRAGGQSAPLGYVIDPSIPPFPRSICTSVNHVVCHGIPRPDEILKNGDIINCDITVIFDGYHGDTSKTFVVGNVDEEALQLVTNTHKAMMAGISAISPHKSTDQIGVAIEDFVAPYGYGIVKEFAGHGIGRNFHEEPPIFHYRQNHSNVKMLPGMIFTVEPMLNLGGSEVVVLDDKWTVITADGSLSAQFEHTCLVTPTGFEILTKI